MTDFAKYSLEDIQGFLDDTINALLRLARQRGSEKDFSTTLFTRLHRFGNPSPEQQAYLATVLAQMLFEAKQPPLALAALRCVENLRANYTANQLIGVLELAGPLCCELIEFADLPSAASVARDLVAFLSPGHNEALDILSCQILEQITMASTNAVNLQRRGHRAQALQTVGFIEARYHDSQFDGLQPMVAAAQLNYGYLILLSNANEARRYFAKALDTSKGHSLKEAQAKRLSEIGRLAQHCLTVIGALEIPAPQIKLGYKEARDAETRRLRMQWLTELPRSLLSRSRRQTHLAMRRIIFGRASTHGAANAVARVTASHTRALEAVIFWACQGNPFVLFLRNFDTSDSTYTNLEGLTHVTVYQHPSGIDGSLEVRSGDALHDKLVSAGMFVLEVANSRGDLDLDRPGYRLYLNDENWHKYVATLVTMAEVIVVKAVHVAEGILAELEIIRNLERSADTIVVIPTQAEADHFLDGLEFRNQILAVHAKYPTDSWMQMQRKSDVGGMVDLTFPEIFTARHPLLQEADFNVVQGLGDELRQGDSAAASVADVVSTVTARIKLLTQQPSRERLISYSGRVADAFESREFETSVVRGPIVSDASAGSAVSAGSCLVITEAAEAKIGQLMRAEGRSHAGFRVSVVPGTMRGFRYRLDFDNRIWEGDLRSDYEDFTLVVDGRSAPYLMGAILNYVDTIEIKGFVVDNPNAVPYGTDNIGNP